MFYQTHKGHMTNEMSFVDFTRGRFISKPGNSPGRH